MGWRDFQMDPPVHYVHKVHKEAPDTPLIGLNVLSVQGGGCELLDISNPEAKKTPRLDLLTKIELEAFNGWYATMRKPEHGMSHEEATHKAWKLLIESMESMYKRKKGRKR